MFRSKKDFGQWEEKRPKAGTFQAPRRRSCCWRVGVSDPATHQERPAQQPGDRMIIKGIIK